MELEDRYVTSTPEGVSLSLVLAGVGSRGAAYLIDFAVQTVIDLAVYAALSATVSSQTSSFVAGGIYALVYFVVTFGYFVLFETFDSGRSLGKRALGIKVTRLDGSGVTFKASLVRNLLRVLYVFPLFYLVDGALIIGSTRNQRLGDFLGGTLVVRERQGATAPLPAGAWQDPRAWSAYQAPMFGWAPGAQVPGPGLPPGAYPYAPYPGWLPPELVSWDVTAVTPADLIAVHAYLARRFEFEPAARSRLAHDLASRLSPRVAGPTSPMDPERFLEAVVLVKSARG
jgi:uncharacterized RDD family membrane protein YckC